MHDHLPIAAGVAGHFQATDDARAEKVAIMQAVLVTCIIGQQLQVVFGQKLSGEEARTNDSLPLAGSASGAAAAAWRDGDLPAAAAATCSFVTGICDHLISSTALVQNAVQNFLSRLPSTAISFGGGLSGHVSG